MNTHAARLTFLAVAMVMCGAGPVRAQSAAPRVEFGGNFGGLVATGGATAMPGTRVGVAISNRFAVESSFDLINWTSTPYGSSQSWLYSVQMKQTLGRGKQPGDGLFATYGAGGGIFHWHSNAQHFAENSRSFDYPASSSTDMSSPTFATVGVASQRSVANYLAVRGDAQLLVAFQAGGGVGARLSAGVSIPIGGYKK